VQIAEVNFFMHVCSSNHAEPVENGKFWPEFPQTQRIVRERLG